MFFKNKKEVLDERILVKALLCYLSEVNGESIERIKYNNFSSIRENIVNLDENIYFYIVDTNFEGFSFNIVIEDITISEHHVQYGLCSERSIIDTNYFFELPNKIIKVINKWSNWMSTYREKLQNEENEYYKSICNKRLKKIYDKY